MTATMCADAERLGEAKMPDVTRDFGRRGTVGMFELSDGNFSFSVHNYYSEKVAAIDITRDELVELKWAIERALEHDVTGGVL